jgi:ATP-dependent protease HslVU (ClpYQ) peptidase subunit
MSCVVAVKKAGRTVMAADSLYVFGQERVPADNSKTLKISTVGDTLMAVTGWSLYANILDDVLAEGETPDLTTERKIFAFFVEFWQVLHERYQFVNDQSNDKDSPFGDLDSSFLIANTEGIFKVSPDSSVSRFEKYYSIGSGSVYALGALHQIFDGPDDAATLARKGVETGIEFDIYCGHPIDVIPLEATSGRAAG